jgi:MFS family permease
MYNLAKQQSSIAATKTKSAILWTNLLNESLFTLYGLLAFILRKDLGATAFQIALLTMLKPLVSLFSFYWSTGSKHTKDRLRQNVFLTGILSRAPFFLFPFLDNVWFFIFAAAQHMLFARAGTPAWMEILKLNLPKREREKYFSLGAALGYAEGVLIAIAFGFLLDHYAYSWKILFFLSACIGIAGVLIQKRLPIQDPEGITESESPDSKENPLIMPWKATWNLMKNRKDFARFQWGFMACGFGIMLIQPALPLFFVDILHISYTDLAIALSICKGLGFVFSSSLWARFMDRIDVSKLSSLVFVGVGLFPLLLMLTPWSLIWLYIAYFVYGIAQAGSHLIWNLSGPLFSGERNSSLYTSVNIVMVGMRGMIAPPLGGILCTLCGPFWVLGFGILLCFYGGKVMLAKVSRRFQPSSDGT